MTKDEIIRVAEEAGMPKWLQEDWFANPFDSFALKFAYLIAAAEREACAKVCEEKVNAEYATGKVDHNEMGWTQACAIAIRARGKNGSLVVHPSDDDWYYANKLKANND